MVVTEQEAEDLFETLAPRVQIPSLSPAYVEIDAVRDEKIELFHWVYREGSSVYMLGIHRMEIPGTGYFDLQTPYQYGGPVVRDADPEFLARAWQEYTKWCQDCKVVVELMRFHPMLQNGSSYHGCVSYNRQAVYIDLKQNDLMSTYGPRVRGKIRKALLNDLSVEWHTGVEHVSLFMELYYAAMLDRNATPFYFFPKAYFERLLTWDKAKLAICRWQGQAIGASIILIGPEISEYHLSCTNADGKRLAATNLILHEAARYSQQMNCSAFYLGGGKETSPDDSLLLFKAGFSSKRADFNIGSWVHDEKSYLELQAGFSGEYRQNQGRVLFYR
jgi:hypothetical protein